MQLDALADCASVREARQTLGVFPSDIRGVYQHTWDRIISQSAEHARLAKTVIIWVLTASRSLTVDELERVAATCPETHKFDPERLVAITTLVGYCRGLVAVEEEGRQVRLVRTYFRSLCSPRRADLPADYTAKEVLQDLVQDSFPHPHSYLAAVCLTHLAECGFQDTSISSVGKLDATLKADPLLALAYGSWTFHVRESIEDREARLRASFFITNARAFPSSDNPLNPLLGFDHLQALHIIAVYNLPMLLLEPEDLQHPNVFTPVFQRTPLSLACANGYNDIVTLLSARPETDVNLVDRYGWSALHWAVREGHASTLSLLLAHSELLVNSIDVTGLSVLLIASSWGRDGIVALLLAHPEIQVNLTDFDGRSALIWAARMGHEVVVSLLLAHPDVQINIVDSQGMSALMLAAAFCHVRVVRLLLQSPRIKTSIKAPAGPWHFGGTAISIALYKGHSEVVDLLQAFEFRHMIPKVCEGQLIEEVSVLDGEEDSLGAIDGSGSEDEQVNWETESNDGSEGTSDSSFS